MLSEVLDHFGFARDFCGAGYYETPYHRQVLQNLRGAIHAGRLIAFTGLVGSGKTLLLRQLRDISSRKSASPCRNRSPSTRSAPA